MLAEVADRSTGYEVRKVTGKRKSHPGNCFCPKCAPTCHPPPGRRRKPARRQTPPKHAAKSLRASRAAQQASWRACVLAALPRSRSKEILTTASARLDDVELETAWQAALRGDLETASNRLERAITTSRVTQRKRRKGDTPWRAATLSHVRSRGRA